jgi:RNA polymerase sigma factor (sigma-70 family)
MADLEFDPHDETDEDLMVFMTWKSEHPDEARAAFAEFHSRHVRYLFAVCLRAYSDDIGNDSVEDLVQETFWRAFEKADTFKLMNGDEDTARRRVRAWLGQISFRLVLTAARQQKHRVRLVSGECELVNNCPGTNAPRRKLTRQEELVRRGLKDLLNEKERHVLEAFASYYDAESEHQYPPDGLVAELCERLMTTEENVRQIRRRALRKLKDFITAQELEIERVKDYVPR